MALSALALNAQLAGNVEQEGKIVAKRAANREALQKFMDSRAALGQKVTPEQAMSFASELTNGGSFIYGFPPDMVTESILQDQNRQATLQQEAQSAAMLENLNKQTTALKNLIPDDSEEDDLQLYDRLVNQYPDARPILQRNIQNIPKMRQEREQEAILNVLRDPMFAHEATPENVRDLFKGYNSRVYDALATRAGYVEKERNQQKVANFITLFNQNKGALTMDDATFEQNLDGIIMTTAAQAGYKIQKGDRLYEDIKNSILGHRAKIKEQKFDLLYKMRNDALSNTHFQSLAAQGYLPEAISMIRGLIGYHPLAQYITDKDIMDVATGINNASLGVAVTNASASLYSSVSQQVDQSIGVNKQLLVSTDFDEDEMRVAQTVAGAYLLDVDYGTISNIQKDIKDGESADSIAAKYKLQPAGNIDILKAQKVQEASAFLPTPNTTMDAYQRESIKKINDAVRTRISKLPPEQQEKAMEAIINQIISNARRLPGPPDKEMLLNQWEMQLRHQFFSR